MTDHPTGVVGIGASAGGIEAFHKFFAQMPPDTGLAFVVVLHLAADRKSLLPEILGRWTGMPVSEAHDGDPITANQVLVVPAGAVAELRDGHLSLTMITSSQPRFLAPIDVFFNSLATALAEDAIGIILSGTGHDGALGLKAIKTHGGLTLAQGGDGTQPGYSGMPESAVAAGGVDLHVSVEAMPDHIIAARKVRSAIPLPTEQPGPDSDRIRLALCAILRSRVGHDFQQYKHQTFMRRVQRRMQVLRLTDYDAFVERLNGDRDEVMLLFRDLLISVTSFFRDTSLFTMLKREIIPRLFERRDAAGDLRIWVPACATGEEAYSLAILLREHMDTLSTVPKVQIFASDIDDVAIGTARAGRFPATLLEGIAAERRTRFFTESPGGYAVRQEIRELCTFSAHSLIRDPPFSRIDLISCRNLLIYLDNDLQDRILPIFHYALVPQGILVLGLSETIGRQERLFRSMDRSNRIFVRLDGPSAVPNVYGVAAKDPQPDTGVELLSRKEPKTHWSKAVAFASRRVLERFAAPFVVVDANGDIAHFSKHTGRFLEPAQGVPGANVFDMARHGWGLELRAALRRCMEQQRPIERQRSIVADGDEKASVIRLIVEPLPSPEAEPLFMIAVVEGETPWLSGELRSADAMRSGAMPAATAPSGEASSEEVPAGAAAKSLSAIEHIENENRDLHEHLTSLVEEHATAVEELRSANEELQSVNEELQSTNEELETSREEIQSINEELNTVNSQLSVKVEQLDRSNGDLKNLFESTKVATVFLDPFMIIRSFTPEIAHIYNLIPSDIGRPLTDIASRLTYSILRQDVETVLRTLQPMEKRVERADRSAFYLMRILPYRSPDSTIDGSLITFFEVSSIVQAEQHQRLLVNELNHRVKNMLTVVISLATNTLRRAQTLEQFQDIFLGRIMPSPRPMRCSAARDGRRSRCERSCWRS